MTFLVQGAGREELAGKSPRDGGAATGAADWSVFQTKSKSVDEQVNNNDNNLICSKRQTNKSKS
jgi:hypothetical protein